jgi:steroid delta-isomerase-like uncharacterized protein
MPLERARLKPLGTEVNMKAPYEGGEMSQAPITDTARGFIEAFNSSDWQRLEGALSPDCEYDEYGTGRRVRGAHEVVELWQGWKRAMPDAEGRVEDVVAGEDRVALEVTWRGTLTGPFGAPGGGEIEQTVKQQVTPAAIVFQFKEGAVSESHQYFDSLALLQQLGVMPVPAATSG